MHTDMHNPRRRRRGKKLRRPFIINRRGVGNSIKSTRLARSIMPLSRKPDDRCDFNNLQGGKILGGSL